MKTNQGNIDKFKIPDMADAEQNIDVVKAAEPVDRSKDQEWLTRKRKLQDPLATKAGGAYIPPAKLRLMMTQIEDKSSEKYQRFNWDRVKKKIHGQVNKVNVGNLVSVVKELLQENIVRGKGLLARSVIQAQAFSPTFSHVYAALIAIINSKFPHIGELVIRRLVISFKRSFKRNDKQTALTVVKFIAHLINQQVVHELLALEILTLLLEKSTDDSVEVACAFLKECGAKLSMVTPRGMNAIFDRLRSILQDSEIDKRVQYMIEVLFHVRKDKFTSYPAVLEELDLVEEEDQITHTATLDDAQDPENNLNVFRLDPEFQKNEDMFQEIKKELLGEGSDSDEEEEEEEEGGEGGEGATTTIMDKTETNLVAFRRTVYLTIQSSLNFDEAAHKLLRMEIKPGFEVELCHMMLDCCAQQRTYEKFYGLLAERFCRLKKEYQEFFEQIFKDTYDTIHRFELTKLRNTTKLFAHLLFTDAITWEVLGHIKLNEDDTTSSGRIFIKVLFLELAEFMGLEKLYERIRDPTLQTAFDGLFPRNDPRNTRFSINFFTSIGLGGLTVDLREHLKSGPKQTLAATFPGEPGGEDDDSSSSDDSDSSSSSSDGDDRQKRKNKKKKKNDVKKSSRTEKIREKAPSRPEPRRQSPKKEDDRGTRKEGERRATAKDPEEREADRDRAPRRDYRRDASPRESEPRRSSRKDDRDASRREDEQRRKFQKETDRKEDSRSSTRQRRRQS